MSPLRLHFKCTLITTPSIPCEPIEPNNQFQVSVCVCSSALFLLLYKIEIMRKQVLTLRLNQPRKILSSFHNKEMGVFVIIGSLPFAHIWGFCRSFINLWRQPSSRRKSKGQPPFPIQIQWCPLYLYLFCPFKFLKITSPSCRKSEGLPPSPIQIQ